MNVAGPYVGIISDHSKGQRHAANSHGDIKVVFDFKYDHYTVLPHLALLERIGGRLKILLFEIREGHEMAIGETDAYRMATGYFVDHILQHCPFLDTLHIKSASLIHCNPNFQARKSLRKLALRDWVIVPQVFTELSARLSRIGSFYITENYFAIEEWGAEIHYNNRSFEVHMPYTSFTTIYWIDLGEDIKNSDTEFYLKVTKSTGTYYFAGNKSAVDKSSEED